MIPQLVFGSPHVIENDYFRATETFLCLFDRGYIRRNRI